MSAAASAISANGEIVAPTCKSSNNAAAPWATIVDAVDIAVRRARRCEDCRVPKQRVACNPESEDRRHGEPDVARCAPCHQRNAGKDPTLRFDQRGHRQRAHGGNAVAGRTERGEALEKERGEPGVVLQRSALNGQRIGGNGCGGERVGEQRRRTERFARKGCDAKAEQRQRDEATPRQRERARNIVETRGKELRSRRIPPVVRGSRPQRVRLHPRRRVGKVVRERIAVEQRSHQLRP